MALDDRPTRSGPGASAGPVAELSQPEVYRSLWNDRDFRGLLLASLTSGLGDWIGLLAIIELTKTLEGASRQGALAVVFVMAARVLPTLGLGPVAGVLVDRWDRKRTMVVTDVVRGLVMLSIAFVGDVFQLVVATFVVEVASTMFIPAKDATVPNLVPRDRLVQANQLSMIATYGTLPVGALLNVGLVALTVALASGGIFAERPAAVPILVNAVSFFASALFIRGITVEERPRRVRALERDEGAGAWSELKEGLAFVARKPMVRALVGGVMAAFVAAGFVVSLGTFFASIVNAADIGFYALTSAVGVGLLAGLAGAGPATRRIAKERLFAPGIGVAGGALVVAALMPELWLALIPAAVMGAGAGLSFVVGYTMLQEHSEDALRGRTFAAFNTGVRAALFASLLVGPAIIFVLGVERTQAQIDAGQQPDSAEELATGADVHYPYQIGGIRLTLMLGGLIGVGGAVWTGRSMHAALTRQAADADADAGPGLGDRTDEVGAPTTWERITGGVFVVLEGGDGAGKSTQMARLPDALAGIDREVVVTREPGGTALAERVRAAVLDPDLDVADRTEALLYAASRAQHVDEVVLPALERGAVVLCDRYVDSSIVYQGVGRGLGAGIVADLNRWATGGLEPDLVVLLDVEAEQGLERAGGEPDRLEGVGLAFHREVNAAYRRLAAGDPHRYLVLPAGLPADDLHAIIRDRVVALVAAADQASRGGDAAADVGAAARDAAGPPPTVALDRDGPTVAHGSAPDDDPTVVTPRVADDEPTVAPERDADDDMTVVTARDTDGEPTVVASRDGREDATVVASRDARREQAVTVADPAAAARRAVREARERDPGRRR